MEDGKFIRKALTPYWWDLSPLEAKIIITLFWISDPDTGFAEISLFGLARKVNVLTKELLLNLEKLRIRGLISFSDRENPFLDVHFKLLYSGNKSHQKNRSQETEEIQYIPFDQEDKKHEDSSIKDAYNDNGNGEKKNDTDLEKNDRSIGNADPSKVKNNNKLVKADKINETLLESEENILPLNNQSLTALSIASELEDEKNLALYKAYFKRYPKTIIYRALKEVLQTPLERIKKSRGAYFTYLVKKYGDSSTD